MPAGVVRLWLTSQYARDTPAYILAYAWQVDGPFDPAAFRAALTAVSGHHEALRTTFTFREGELSAMTAWRSGKPTRSSSSPGTTCSNRRPGWDGRWPAPPPAKEWRSTCARRRRSAGPAEPESSPLVTVALPGAHSLAHERPASGTSF
jgi:hypothetical protein